MSNSMTGDFEAAVQLAIRQINGLLATLHQNGAAEDAPLKLLHSVSVKVGEPRRPHPDLDVFDDWVIAFQAKARPGAGLGDLRGQLTGAAPPGAAKMLMDAFTAFDDIVVVDIPPDVVRGRLKLQLATATLHVPPGSTTEVAVHVHVRGHYYPAPGTTVMPAPIHGEVRATFDVAIRPSPSNFTIRQLVIRPSADDGKIQFVVAPGTGLTATDVARISAQVRHVVREGFDLIPVDLPEELTFTGFKGVGSGAAEALALGVQLSEAGAPPGGLIGLTQSVVGPSGFALAIGKEFVLSKFQPTIDRLRAFEQSFEVSVTGPNPTYHFKVTSVELRFEDGAFVLVIKGHAHHWFWPDYDPVITQKIRLLMFFGTLFIRAEDDELTVTGLPSSGNSAVRSAVIAERNRALPPIEQDLNQQLGDARNRLNEALRSFDPSLSASFRSGFTGESGAAASGGIAITADGVIVRGNIDGGPRAAPVVHVGETDQGQSFTALQSWIPGGRVERLIWSWVEYAHPAAWNGVSKSLVDEHRFILPKPPGITAASSICLRIEGTQILPNGQVVSAAGGTICLAPEPGIVMDVPSWWAPVMVPVWSSDVPDDAVLRDAIAGHVTVQSDVPRGETLTQNTLVYFADWRGDRPLATLASAFGLMRTKRFSLGVIVVLPAGAFARSRREVEAKLASLGERVPARVQLTEDDEGGWTRTFAPEKTPAAYLIDARRAFVWKHEGEPEARALAAALDEHLVPVPAPRAQPLRLSVAPGDRAPDVLFQDDQGGRAALHRMRGQRALLTFWQSWSAPCLRELERLQGIHARGEKEAPVIVAFHGGKDARALEDIRRRLSLSFALVQDAEQRIARQYGVRCWPTTVTVGRDGHVEHVQFGVGHDHPRKG